MEWLTDNIDHPFICIMFFIAGLILGNIEPLKKQPETNKQPIIIYKVDNAGTGIYGKISDKEIIEGRYAVTVPSYGRFLVTKEQYESIRVGDDMPEYLKK